ncbi:MAG: hypothetical protein IJ567_06410 [Lachnospiraceae bacterium]|nr:hypothetical protein [Lachnospiraceae bacterium]
MKRSKRSRACDFTLQMRQKIHERDGNICIFCAAGRWDVAQDIGIHVKELAHIIPRSQGGLGTDKNAVVACKNHHQLMDDGNKGCRAEMLEYAKEYLKEIYPDWDEKQLVYNKWDF